MGAVNTFPGTDYLKHERRFTVNETKTKKEKKKIFLLCVGSFIHALEILTRPDSLEIFFKFTLFLEQFVFNLSANLFRQHLFFFLQNLFYLPASAYKFFVKP